VLEEVEEFSVADILHLELGLVLLLLAEEGVINLAVMVVVSHDYEVVVESKLLHFHFVVIHAPFAFGHFVYIFLEQLDGDVVVGLSVACEQSGCIVAIP